jgi:ATP diphosphatase
VEAVINTKSVVVSLKLESSSNEAAHTFSPLAIERWEKLSKAEQHIFLNNAYCSQCKTAVTIVNVSGTVEGSTLVLQGLCGTCGNKIARIVE